MADPRKTPLDRGRYPILERKVGRGGARPLVYLDSAATSLVSERVTEACAAFLRTSCANIHRGAHTLTEEATDAYEGADASNWRASSAWKMPLASYSPAGPRSR